MNQLNLKAIRPCLVLGSCLATYRVVQGILLQHGWRSRKTSPKTVDGGLPIYNLKPLSRSNFSGLQQRTGRFQVFPGLLMESASRVLHFFARNVWCLFSCTQRGDLPRSKLKLLILGMVVPRLVRNPYNGYRNPYYWVDDHPLTQRGWYWAPAILLLSTKS